MSVVAAALIFSIVCTVLDKKSALSAIIKTIAGLFVTLTALSPIVSLDLPDLTEYFSMIERDAVEITSQGTAFLNSERSVLIKERSEAYILEKALSLGLDLTVDIKMKSNEQPLPDSIEIHGDASPYAKAQLTDLITTDLGIPEEYQKWN